MWNLRKNVFAFIVVFFCYPVDLTCSGSENNTDRYGNPSQGGKWKRFVLEAILIFYHKHSGKHLRRSRFSHLVSCLVAKHKDLLTDFLTCVFSEERRLRVR
jgi:hypothetical protein